MRPSAIRRGLLVLGLAALGAGAYGISGCAAPPPPPPLRVEVRPAAPGPKAVWVPGHWKWRGRARGYDWAPGHWKVR